MTGNSLHVVTISGDAGLRAAQDIAGLLRQALTEHDRVAIATDAMSGADITTIQLLLAAHRQALALGKTVSLQAPATGVLRELLIQTGCLSADGKALTPDDDFWTQGKPA